MKRDTRPLHLFEPTQAEKQLILIALETIQIIGQGYYKKGERQILLSDGNHQNFSLAVPYSPKALEGMRISRPANRCVTTCKIQVADCDSLEAAAGLDTPLVMNFADALTPGGRFLYGAATQEESLCRASTLYTSLTSPKAAEMYRYHWEHPSPVNSDYMLLSPEVCVFRGTDRSFLDKVRYLCRRPGQMHPCGPGSSGGAGSCHKKAASEPVYGCRAAWVSFAGFGGMGMRCVWK